MSNAIDILENEILEKYPKVLDILLRDHTTQRNIIWATNNYENLGESYHSLNQIELLQITGINGNVIMPRVQKNLLLQQSRVKNMAEVFTPSWICNAQNNLIDNAWFQRKNIFNKLSNTNINKWETNYEKITFPIGKTWQDYVKDKRLEITCGEAPYITSRYDTTTGKFIEVEDRIGLLDRKLRVINENVENFEEWLKAVQTAYKSIYAYEWQGDSLLLAREAMLITFIENYILKFGKEPFLNSLQTIATIIAWNVWQMDGLKCTIPESCNNKEVKELSLFDEFHIKTVKCEGCEKDLINKHNGIYCLIKDWEYTDEKAGIKECEKRFVDLIEGI